MRQYVAFLNMLHERNLVDLDKIEDWWIDRVKEYFEGKPFILHYDQSKSFRIIFNDLLSQAEQRQAQSPCSTNKINVAKELAKQYTIENRIDFFDVEQFLVGNIYEISKFSPLSRKTTAIQLINEYNKIIKECETDPSLYIVIANGG